MVYGGGMPFHAARSCRVMPLSVAIRYRFWPRWTVVVTPYFGVDTVTGPRWLPPPALRLTTWLLPHAANNSAATTTAPIRPSRLIRPVPSTPGNRPPPPATPPRPSPAARPSGAEIGRAHV